MDSKKHRKIFYNFIAFTAYVLIWRGIWGALDYIDMLLFNQVHIVSLSGGFILGLIILLKFGKEFY